MVCSPKHQDALMEIVKWKRVRYYGDDDAVVVA